MDQKENKQQQQQQAVSKSKSEEAVNATASVNKPSPQGKDVRFELKETTNIHHHHHPSSASSPKVSRKYFTNWKHACGKTKDRTRELLKRWRTLPETDLPEDDDDGEQQSRGDDKSEDGDKKQGQSAGWTVHVWTTWVNRYSVDDADGDDQEHQEQQQQPEQLSAIQAEKMTSFFVELLDLDRDELVGEQDFEHFVEKLAHFADWSYNSPEYHILLEVKNEFVENFIHPLPSRYSEKMYWRRLSARLPRGMTDLKNWLARWPLYLPSCSRFNQLPLFLQYFCKILFAVINRSGSGAISRQELKSFYMSVGGVSAARCEEIIDTAFNYLTSNEHLQLDFETYKRCFSNWLCGKNPNGAGQWAVIPPKNLSREPYPVDYSALNCESGRLERYAPDDIRTSRHSIIV